VTFKRTTIVQRWIFVKAKCAFLDITRHSGSSLDINFFFFLSYTGCLTGLVHGLHIDLKISIGYVEPKSWVHIKALLSRQLLRYWPAF
jgi:hypothetical protein